MPPTPSPSPAARERGKGRILLVLPPPTNGGGRSVWGSASMRDGGFGHHPPGRRARWRRRLSSTGVSRKTLAPTPAETAHPRGARPRPHFHRTSGDEPAATCPCPGPRRRRASPSRPLARMAGISCSGIRTFSVLLATVTICAVLVAASGRRLEQLSAPEIWGHGVIAHGGLHPEAETRN